MSTVHEQGRLLVIRGRPDMRGHGVGDQPLDHRDAHIMQKMKAESLAELVRMAGQLGIASG